MLQARSARYARVRGPEEPAPFDPGAARLLIEDLSMRRARVGGRSIHSWRTEPTPDIRAALQPARRASRAPVRRYTAMAASAAVLVIGGGLIFSRNAPEFSPRETRGEQLGLRPAIAAATLEAQPRPGPAAAEEPARQLASLPAAERPRRAPGADATTALYIPSEAGASEPAAPEAVEQQAPPLAIEAAASEPLVRVERPAPSFEVAELARPVVVEPVDEPVRQPVVLVRRQVAPDLLGGGATGRQATALGGIQSGNPLRMASAITAPAGGR